MGTICGGVEGGAFLFSGEIAYYVQWSLGQAYHLYWHQELRLFHGVPKKQKWLKPS